MALRFYNSLTRSKELFQPLVPGQAGLYTCGPTVYNYAHIGNFRTFVFEDLLRRVLAFRGYRVTQVMNFTDVDDKTIRGSQAAGESLEVFTARYKQAFFEDLDTLRVQHAEVYPAATEHVEEMVELIRRLRERGHTYEDAGSVYFRLSTFPGYGRLANLNPDQMRTSGRVDNDEYEKEDVRDFALWKAWTPEDGPVFWETELGKGRPGWHIECSAMSMKYLGEQFDIHTGGVDNRFPHHENEIAQSCCATGGPFASTWLHSEFLLVEGKKMSKSLGNFYTLRDLLEKGLDPVAIRYTLLSVHYRAQLNFSFEGIEASAQAVRRLRDLNARLGRTPAGPGSGDKARHLTATCESEFTEALDDDLNLAGALGHLFTWVREVNALLDSGSPDAGELQLLQAWLGRVDGLLDVLREEQDESAEGRVAELVAQRAAAKQSRDFPAADRLRLEIESLGWVVKDTPQGPVFHRR
ncbi:MAG: cysteine--tRNA ligase [Candidatus Delongbacteria bacterium]